MKLKHVSKRKGWTILMVDVNGHVKTIKFLRARMMLGIFICIIAVLSTLVMAQMYYQVSQENKQIFEKLAIHNAVYGDEGIIRLPCNQQEEPYQLVSHSDIYQDHNYIALFEEPYHYKRRYDFTLSETLDVIPEIQPEPESTIRYHQMVRASDIKLIINQKNNRIGFSFILRNIVKSKRAISGTSFVVLKNDEDAVAYPAIKVRNGRPVNYKKGRPFYVARFKTVRHRLKDIEHFGNFTKATILVYSKHGRLLVEETIPIHMTL